MNIIRTIVASALVAGAAFTTLAAPAAPADSVTAAASVTSEQTDSASRAVAAVMGPLIARNISQIQSLGVPVDRKVFVSALATYLEGGSIGFDAASADAYISDRVRALHPAPVDTVSVASQKAFLAKAAAEEGAMTLPDGVVFTIIQEGEGAMPTDADKVTVKYVGRLSDGTVFDDTEDENVVFDVTGVIPGFSESLKQMRPGGTYRITIPADRAYGVKGITGVIPGNAALEFTITLLGVNMPQPQSK